MDNDTKTPQTNNQNSGHPDNPQQPVEGNPIADQYTSVPVEEQPKKIRKGALALAVLFLVSIALSVGYYSWQAPRVQAREYITLAANQLDEINSSLGQYTESYSELSNTVDEIRQAFLTMTDVSTDYFVTLDGVLESVEYLQNTLDTIEKKREELSAYTNIPEDVSKLDNNIRQYLDTAETALSLLLEHYEFQLTMMRASGAEYNEQVARLDSMITDAYIDEELVSYFENLTQLSGEAYQNLQDISEVPELQQDVYINTVNQHEVSYRAYSGALAYFLDPSEENEAIMSSRLSELGERQSFNHAESQRISDKFREESELAQLFTQVEQYQLDLDNELTVLREEYGAEA